ncbi:MAG: hypothetical protein J0H08_12420 [Rhizobiales bacterium]|nr:hypothetical protein [Hyphomicrobiales bacterium]
MPKQTTDISGNPYAITYAAAGETWTIAKGVDVFGADVGIFSAQLNSTLKNNGSINGSGAGVVFNGNDDVSAHLIKNGGKGKIHGAEAAAAIIDFAGSARIDNKGSISGLMSGAYLAGSSDVTVKNEGTISGAYQGIYVRVESISAFGPVVDNHGKVDAGLIGVGFEADESVRATLHNHNGAVIESKSVAVASGAQLTFTNEGKVKGSVITDEGADVIVNKGKMGDVSLGDAIDSFKNKGSAKSGMIDTGDGNDLVVLGKKADTLLFASDLDAMTNVDTIKKFESGKDKIYLNLDIFTELSAGPLSANQFHKGTAAADADDRIIYDQKTGSLYYDADGSGAGAQVQFADLGAGTKLKVADIKAGYMFIDFPAS